MIFILSFILPNNCFLYLFHWLIHHFRYLFTILLIFIFIFQVRVFDLQQGFDHSFHQFAFSFFLRIICILKLSFLFLTIINPFQLAQSTVFEFFPQVFRFLKIVLPSPTHFIFFWTLFQKSSLFEKWKNLFQKTFWYCPQIIHDLPE